ncbi:MAG TPA: asparaginase domain-containing protein [Chitinophagaceae bacterium]|nr:asparaginase domain-containing protein [Chitinophagaceae bacterium]
MNNNEAIRILVTGGTFDKEYDMIQGKLNFEETHVPEMLQLGRCRLDIEVRTIMMIDSLDMTDADRASILYQCQQSPESKIVITHGTDTMAETAAYLAKEDLEKTIILTGAMIPYKFGSSDGFFNLGSALAFVQTLPVGVYVVMNGRYYDWNNVRKNNKTGYFEELKEL